MPRARKRQAKDEASKKDVDLLKPLDMDIIGTDDDPCFGQLYDLKEEECQMCGDSALCQIVFSQHLNIKRLKVEKENTFTDMEVIGEDKNKDIIKYYEKILNKTGKKSTAKAKTKKKFKIDSKQLKQILS